MSYNNFQFLWNGQNFRKCLVNNTPVRMRITDQWFCLLDLAKAGGKNSKWVIHKARLLDPSSKESYRDGNYQRVLVAPRIVLLYLNELGLQNNTALHQLISNGGTIGVSQFLCAQLGLDYDHFMKEIARACTSDQQDSGNEINTLRIAVAMHLANKTDGEGGVNAELTKSLHSAQLPTKHHPGFVLEPGTEDSPDNFPAARCGNMSGHHNASMLASESSGIEEVRLLTLAVSKFSCVCSTNT
jgi:hypothetical protein